MMHIQKYALTLAAGVLLVNTSLYTQQAQEKSKQEIALATMRAWWNKVPTIPGPIKRIAAHTVGGLASNAIGATIPAFIINKKYFGGANDTDIVTIADTLETRAHLRYFATADIAKALAVREISAYNNDSAPFLKTIVAWLLFYWNNCSMLKIMADVDEDDINASEFYSKSLMLGAAEGFATGILLESMRFLEWGGKKLWTKARARGSNQEAENAREIAVVKAE